MTTSANDDVLESEFLPRAESPVLSAQVRAVLRAGLGSI